ncbi:MAG: hypothetical protein IJ368_03700 [Oscillospiraceae bacterium]|nr:hypothetical protein [Oscillospiraceae bacterium]
MSANAIELMKKYIPYLDVAYREGAATSVLDVPDQLAQAGKTARSVVVPVMDTDGLADYSRNGGYVRRGTNLKYEEYTYNYDRGGIFEVDSMDNAETDSVAFGSLAGRVMKDRVIPEMDAFRFATYASADDVENSEGLLVTGEEAISALRAGMSYMDEQEVNSEGRILFITPTLAGSIDDLDTTRSRKVFESFSKVIKVPQKRFYTGIDLLDGESENEIAGGYKKADGAADINFMIIEKSAIIQHTKHSVNKIIDAAANQHADAYMFFCRFYGLADVYKNRTAGIYVHHKPVV